MSERDVLAAVLRLSVGDVRLLRNNCGAFPDPTRPGHWIRYGVCNPGGSDAIGWRTVLITPDHVGRRLAIFTAIETKAHNGRPTIDQQRFLDAVQRAGGIAGIARSVADAQRILSEFPPLTAAK